MFNISHSKWSPLFHSCTQFEFYMVLPCFLTRLLINTIVRRHASSRCLFLPSYTISACKRTRPPVFCISWCLWSLEVDSATKKTNSRKPTIPLVVCSPVVAWQEHLPTVHLLFLIHSMPVLQHDWQEVRIILKHALLAHLFVTSANTFLMISRSHSHTGTC